MPNFLSLPFEVRTIIYNHYLIVGKISPYLEKQLEEEKAQVNAALLKTEASLPSLPMIREEREYPPLYLDLLRVNKLIHEEATIIVYQKITVVLHHAPLAVKFFQNCLNTLDNRLWLKDVEIEFCVSDMSLDEKKDWLQSKGLDLPIASTLARR